MSFNQFEVNGSFLRQVSGLFMGSSISPPVAMAYMEYFEEHKYEKYMPSRLKASVWERFVDDCFVVYEGSDAQFDVFLNKLNRLDDHIKFTCEMSKPGSEYDLGDDVTEAIPFLDLLVTRHLDRHTGMLSNKLAIYRKPCHSSSYIHYLSAQPVFTKRSVIRSIFLRAYRYCDPLFLDKEIDRIYADFSRLGYHRRFIDKARTSAKDGHTHEVRIKNGDALPREPRQRQDYTLVVPFHRRTTGLRRLGHERGIDVVYSCKDSLGSRVAHGSHSHTDSGVYMIPCKQQSCEKVYVGQSQNIPVRMEDHTAAIGGRRSLQRTAVARHRHNDFTLDPDKVVVPYRSSSKSRRLMIETSLITLCNTVHGTKASSNVTDMDTIGPILLGASNIDWKAVSSVQHNLNPSLVPKKHRHLFRTRPPSPTPRGNDLNNSASSPSLILQPRYTLRSQSRC